MVQKELASTVTVPAVVRLRLWRRGFLSESWVLYDLKRNDIRDYLPDYARFTRTRLINGRYAAILDNKLLFDRIVGQKVGLIPYMYGILESGRLIDVMGHRPVQAAEPALLEALHETGTLALKPLTGGGGHGFVVLRHDDEHGYSCSGTSVSAEELGRFIASCDNYLACEFLRQHRDMAVVNPSTTNTIRILTLQDESQEPFIACAVFRVGSEKSAPTDNWTRGGLSAKIDVTSGHVGAAVAYPYGSDRLTWHSNHPDTGIAIEGMTIPNWAVVRNGVLDVFRSLPVLKYVGWDVVVTEDGFRILEGNNYTDVNLLQVHAPLLRDERVRSFYQRHGIMR